MVDVEYERDRAEILLNRSYMVLQQLGEYWESPRREPYKPGELLPGYLDVSDPDSDEWELQYKDADMAMRISNDERMSTHIQVQVNGYDPVEAGDTYDVDELTEPVVYEAFWKLYKMIKGM